MTMMNEREKQTLSELVFVVWIDERLSTKTYLQIVNVHFGAECFIAAWRLGGDLRSNDQKFA